MWTDERGQDIAEYAVIMAVILVLVVGTVRLVGSNANHAFSSVAVRCSSLAEAATGDVESGQVVQSTIVRWLPLSREVVTSLRSVRRLRHGPLRVGDLAGVRKEHLQSAGNPLQVSLRNYHEPL
jgi:Flp pilus assembly pilin Flp